MAFHVGQVLWNIARRDLGPGVVTEVTNNGARLNFADGKEANLFGSFLSDDPDATRDAERLRVARANNLIALPRPNAAAAPEIRIVAASDFAGRERPSRVFLDERQLIPWKNVTLLYGDGATGKSLLAMQLAVGCAVTGHWMAQRVRRGPVLYFSAEDDEDETHIRLAEIAEADGFDLAAAVDLHVAIMAGHDAILASEEQRSALLNWTPLFARLRTELDTRRPALLVLDNLADVFGGNENVKSLARQFIGKLRGLAIEFGCSIVMLAHPSQSGMSNGTGTSGNVGWSNSARSRLYLRREASEDGVETDPDRRTLESMKANYGRAGTTVSLAWQAGRFICLDEPTQTFSQPFAGAAKAMKAERVFMDLLRWHLRHDKFVSPNRSVAYAPTQFAQHQRCEGVKKREFEHAMISLLDREEIMIFTHGRGQSRRQHIGLPLGAEGSEHE